MADASVAPVIDQDEAQDDVFVPRATFHALRQQNPVDILRRWAAGETLKQIAQSFQVSPAAITQWIDRNVPQEQREQARELHYQTRLDDGLEGLEAAGDDVNLARAREPYLRRLEWRAQTECKRWQPKQQVSVDIGTDLGELLRAQKRASSTQHSIDHSTVIDVTPVKDA